MSVMVRDLGEVENRVALAVLGVLEGLLKTEHTQAEGFQHAADVAQNVAVALAGQLGNLRGGHGEGRGGGEGG